MPLILIVIVVLLLLHRTGRTARATERIAGVLAPPSRASVIVSSLVQLVLLAILAFVYMFMFHNNFMAWLLLGK